MTGSVRYFYDVEDIKPGWNWRKVLEANARTCVLIALRTEEYENRFWCRKEYLWAEEMRVPILVVDLRSRQSYSGARLPFGPAPTVRVHDGNLIRVILRAVAVHLKVLRAEFQVLGIARRKKVRCVVLPRHPSEISLRGALDELSRGTMPSGGAKILHPSPALSPVYQRAVQPIIDGMPFHVDLLSLDDWETT